MARTPSRFVSIYEAANYLDVSAKSIRRWIALGRIPGYRVGNLIKVDRADLDAFIQPVPTGDAA